MKMIGKLVKLEKWKKSKFAVGMAVGLGAALVIGMVGGASQMFPMAVGCGLVGGICTQYEV